MSIAPAFREVPWTVRSVTAGPIVPDTSLTPSSVRLKSPSTFPVTLMLLPVRTAFAVNVSPLA